MNTEIFIDKHRCKFGDLFDYSKTSYVNSKTKLIVICREHGDFLKTAGNHFSSAGCPKCVAYGHKKKVSSSTEKFIISANKLHGKTYDYNLVDYKSSIDPVEIICSRHGSFYMTPNRHLKGCGCQKCALDNQKTKVSYTQEDFLNKCKALKTDYDYSLVSYTGIRDKVKIICKTHGVFEQIACNHLRGRGCYTCAKSGYDPAKNGFLYILKNKDITKIGITNVSVQERCRSISRSYGSKFDISLFVKFEDGKVADNLESLLLEDLRGVYDRPDKKFEGSTEAFLNVDFNYLLSRITHYSGELLPHKT